MKIVRTIESFYPFMSGSAKEAFMISRHLVQQDIPSPILTTFYKARQSPRQEQFENVTVERYPNILRCLKYLYTPSMKQAVRNHNPSLIHAHNYRNYQTAMGYRLAKELKIPFIVSVHGSLAGFRKIVRPFARIPYLLFDFWGGKRAIELADAVIVSSSKEYEEAKFFGVDPSRLHLIPMGINVDDYNLLRTRQDEKFVLLFVGRICSNRNIIQVIESLRDLKDQRIELRIVGPEVKLSDMEKSGYLDKCKKAASGLSVTFTGPKYGQDLRQEYCNADAFIYLSSYESFGIPLLEAAAAGLPLLATPVGIAEDLIEHGKTGFLIRDLKHIGDYIQKVRDPVFRESCRKQIRVLVDERFSWTNIIEKYISIYKQVIKSS